MLQYQVKDQKLEVLNGEKLFNFKAMTLTITEIKSFTILGHKTKMFEPPLVFISEKANKNYSKYLRSLFKKTEKTMFFDKTELHKVNIL